MPILIQALHPRPNAKIRLLCLPYAGGRAAVFRPLARLLPESIELHAVDYPGRVPKSSPPPFTDLHRLAEAAEGEFRRFLESPGPIAVLGYSYGAFIAFEWLRRRETAGAPPLLHFFACAQRAPHLPLPRLPLHHLPEQDFIREVQRVYGKFPDVLLQEPEMLALFLPTLRADLKAFENYQFQPGAPIRCSITAYGGKLDPGIPGPSLQDWSQHTQGAFEFAQLPGDHFFLNTHPQELAKAIAKKLQTQ